MAFEDSGASDDSGAEDVWPALSVSDQAALEMAPKVGGSPPTGSGIDWRDVAGKIWNAPNTALGLVYGGLGMAAGEAGHLLGLQDQAPKAFVRDNAVQFTNNPLGGRSAITLGNTTTWYKDPYDPSDRYWRDADGVPYAEGRHTYPEHETAHTYQGQQLGPLYLPSNAAGGLMGLLFDRDKDGIPDWHGQHNWNEQGPLSDIPVPWPARVPQ